MVVAAVPKRYLENVFFWVIEGNSSFCARSKKSCPSCYTGSRAIEFRGRDSSLCYLDERDSLDDRLDAYDDTSSDFTNRLKK